MKRYDLNELDLLTPRYLDELGLREPPFAPGDDRRFFHLDEARAQHLELIGHLLRQPTLMLVVSGPAGSGKTAFAQRLAETLAADCQVCTLAADPLFGPQELLIRIAHGFGLDPRAARAELGAQLSEHLAGLAETGRLPVLLLDDAHTLAPDALETVLQFGDEVGPAGQLLRVVLFSQLEVDDLLDASRLGALRASITHSLGLPTLSVAETGQYLEHRLRVAGLEGESPLPPSAVRRIRRRSGGLPGRINLHAHRWLSGARGGWDPIAMLPAGRPPARLLLSAGLVSLLIAAVWAALGSRGDDEAQVTVALPPPVADVATRSGLPPFPSGPTRALSTGDSQAAPAARSEPGLPSAQSMPAAATAAAADTAPTPAVATAHGVPQPTPTEGGEDKPGAGPEIGPDSAAVEATAAARALRLRGKEWIEAREPDHYTLQLFATVNEARVEDFVAQHALQGAAAYYRTREEDGDLYHLVFGDHPSRTQAETAVHLLPESMREMTPWVRPFRAIQTQLAAAGGAASPSLTPRAETGPSVSAPSKPSASGAWLWDQDPRHFTLQLLGTRSEESLQGFIRRHGLAGKVAYFRTLRDGEGWYVLVHGVYPDREAARAALAELPEDLRAAKPWPRSFASLHAEVGSR